MNLTTLLTFVPLAIGITWLFNLIFQKDLASQTLPKIVSYFVGVLIIVLVVGYFLDNMLPSWVNNRYQNSRTNVELQQFINTIIGDASSGDLTTVVVDSPTPIPVDLFPPNNPNPAPGPTIISPIADPNPNANVDSRSGEGVTGGATTHFVQPGDTLNNIASRYGVALNDLRAANNRLTNDFIYAGETLVIPYTTTGK